MYLTHFSFFFQDDIAKNAVPDDFPNDLGLYNLLPNDNNDDPQATSASSYRTNCNTHFYYFVTRMLSSVNNKITNFEGKKANILFGEIFSVSDEAYALIILINELHVWKEQIKEKKKQNKNKLKCKFVSPRSGKKDSWSNEGRMMYNNLCRKIKELRSNESTGNNIENELLLMIQNSSDSLSEKTCSSKEKENGNVIFDDYIDDDLQQLLLDV